MKELRAATTKDSKSIVEDILKLIIVGTFPDRISEDGVTDGNLYKIVNNLELNLKKR